ncbi:hypothetical protein ACP70R_022887 [Stipagrostis hirtigluma subsp. patula]
MRTAVWTAGSNRAAQDGWIWPVVVRDGWIWPGRCLTAGSTGRFPSPASLACGEEARRVARRQYGPSAPARQSAVPRVLGSGTVVLRGHGSTSSGSVEMQDDGLLLPATHTTWTLPHPAS